MKKAYRILLGIILVLCFAAIRGDADEGGKRQSIHRLGMFSIGMVKNWGEATDTKGLALELVSYEYISKFGISFRFAPLNVYYWEGNVGQTQKTFSYYGDSFSHTYDVTGETVNYVPFWLRYYFRERSKNLWPFIGIGFGLHYYAQNPMFYTNGELDPGNEVETTIVPFELGIDIGNTTFARSAFALKIFPGTNAAFDDTLYSLSYSLSLGWLEKK